MLYIKITDIVMINEIKEIKRLYSSITYDNKLQMHAVTIQCDALMEATHCTETLTTECESAHTCTVALRIPRELQ
jgi:hypothetical protein